MDDAVEHALGAGTAALRKDLGRSLAAIIDVVQEYVV